MPYLGKTKKNIFLLRKLEDMDIEFVNGIGRKHGLILSKNFIDTVKLSS